MIMLDTDKLKVGMVVSYGELCKAVGINVSTNREAQLKTIRRWVDIEKIDRYRYKVIKILEKPVRKCDLKKINKRPVGRPRKNPIPVNKTVRENYYLDFKKGNKFPEAACHILLNELLNNGTGVYTNIELCLLLGMANDNITDNNKFKELLPSMWELSTGMYYMKEICNNILQKNIFTNLFDQRKIFVKEDTYRYKEYNSDEYKVADKKEVKVIDELIDEILKDNDLKLYTELYFPKDKDKGKAFKAKDILNDLIRERLGWASWVKCKRISISDKVNIQDIKKYKTYDTLIDKEIINAKVAERFRSKMYKSGMEYYNHDPSSTIVPAIGEGTDIGKEGFLEYCNNVEQLIEIFIKI